MSLYTRVITASSLSTGLTTLGVTVYDQGGNTLITRVSFGIIEVTTGNYSISIPNWDSTWSGIIKWDNNGTIVYLENFTGDVPTFPSSSAYITVEQASLYFQTRLGTDAWDNAIPTDQVKALAQATRMIDRLNFIGIKANCTQLLQWPRIIRLPCVGGSVTVGGVLPTDIEMAVAELALNLLDGIDPDLEDELLGSASDAYATVRVTSDPKLARDHIKAGIISATAWRLLLPWLKDPRSVTLLKG
jgi:hypothetical protein